MTTKRTKGWLALASGRIFTGAWFGAPPERLSRPCAGEVVFNTALTGYQEILTDPSYEGQIVVMTAAHIGNTGVNTEDVESRGLFLSGFIVQELSEVTSNWRAQKSLDAYLTEAGVAGLTGVDTRALTLHLRTQGAIRGLLSTDGRNLEELIRRAKALPGLEGRDLAKNVTTKTPYAWTETTGAWGLLKPRTGPPHKVVVMDFGVKQNILRSLADWHADITVMPASTSAREILAMKPDGVLLSNGPGDPSAVTYAAKTIETLVRHVEDAHTKGEKPMAIFGICLGHQLLGIACGGRTYKLKFGHHGGNHPVKDLETGRVDVTTQNHGFAVEGTELRPGVVQMTGNADVRATHINMNDGSIEGLRHTQLPIFSVQHHPEASPGPHDADIFDRFIARMDGAASGVTGEASAEELRP